MSSNKINKATLDDMFKRGVITEDSYKEFMESGEVKMGRRVAPDFFIIDGNDKKVKITLKYSDASKVKSKGFKVKMNENFNEMVDKVEEILNEYCANT